MAINLIYTQINAQVCKCSAFICFSHVLFIPMIDFQTNFTNRKQISSTDLPLIKCQGMAFSILLDIYFADATLQLQLEAAKMFGMVPSPCNQSAIESTMQKPSLSSQIKNPKGLKRRLSRWDSPPKRSKSKVSNCCIKKYRNAVI